MVVIVDSESERITCVATGVKREISNLVQSGLVEFITPLNDLEIVIKQKKKKVRNSALYHQVHPSWNNLKVRGFRLYLVHTCKRTKVVSASQEIFFSGHKLCKKRNQKPISNKANVLKGKARNLGQSPKKSSTPVRRIQTGNASIYIYRTVNHNITMVLSSDDFVFKPTIPINETNYPLDNIDKRELYDSEKPMDKILSYSFTDPAIKNYIKFPSVSKIIEETISDKTRQVLANWRQKMIGDLGEDGFFNHNEALKTRGTEFHMAVRNAVLGKTSENNNYSEVTQNSLKSLSWVLEHITHPMAVESTIAHPKLGYRGVADCIAMFRQIPVIIDWKLSDKPKRDLKDTYDAPVQITAYIGALNHDPNYQWGVNHGLVAVAYANGDPCDVFLLAPKHCQIYWRHWLMRFDKFKDSDVGRRWFQRGQRWKQNKYPTGNKVNPSYRGKNRFSWQTRYSDQNHYGSQHRYSNQNNYGHRNQRAVHKSTPTDT